MSERLTDEQVAEALRKAQEEAESPIVAFPKQSRLVECALLQVSADLSEANIDRHNAKAFLKSENKDRWDAFLMLDGTNDHGHADECPTYYDGCHCSVEVLTHNIQRAEKAESALSALQEKAREAVEAGDWVLHVASGVGKFGDEPEPGEHEAAYDASKDALSALRALLPAEPK